MATLSERVRWKLYPYMGKWRPDLRVDPVPFQGFKDATLRGVAGKIQKTRFLKSMPGVEGWLTVREKQALYAFARWLPGPFLEIGSWVGLSTCHIATGIKDSGERKLFVAAELNPTVENFRPDVDGIGFYYPKDSTENMGSCTLREYHEEIEPILTSPGGVLGTLNRNLDRMGVADLVSVHEGQFSLLPDMKPRFIFIDAMHSPQEIARNAKQLRRFLSPGAVLACHDLNCHPENQRTLLKEFKFVNFIVTDSLLIGEIP